MSACAPPGSCSPRRRSGAVPLLLPLGMPPCSCRPCVSPPHCDAQCNVAATARCWTPPMSGGLTPSLACSRRCSRCGRCTALAVRVGTCEAGILAWLHDRRLSWAAAFMLRSQCRHMSTHVMLLQVPMAVVSVPACKLCQPSQKRIDLLFHAGRCPWRWSRSSTASSILFRKCMLLFKRTFP